MSDATGEGSAATLRDAANGRLLADIARDIAHELRGPVQSIVVNLEVARIRIRQAASDDAAERLAVIEQEVMRMHRVADAFVSLLRPDDAPPRPVSLESILAGLDPLAAVVARSAHVHLERAGCDPALLAHVRTGPASLAILRLIVDAVAAAGRDGSVSVSAAADGGATELRIGIRAAAGHQIDAEALGRSAELARATWLVGTGGTAAVRAGSDAGGVTVAVRFTPPA